MEKVKAGITAAAIKVHGIRAAIYSFCLSIYVAVISSPFAFATGDTAGAIQDGVKTGMGEIYGIVTAIVVPIAVVALAVCAIKILWGNQRSAEEAKSTAIKIVIAIAIVYLAPLIISQVAGWFANTGDAGVFN